MPIHRASENGNPACIRWILETWASKEIELDIDAVDHNGYSPLYLVCYKGYNGADGLVGMTPEMMANRLECAKLLIQRNANVNFQTEMLGMTPLHWAAFQGDAEMTKLLIENGARTILSNVGNTPVDIAGFCGKEHIVSIFANALSDKIKAEMDAEGLANDQSVEAEDAPAESLDPENPEQSTTKLWQVSPEGTTAEATRTYKHLE